jgi:predicted RNase H-like nuclease
MVWICGVDGFKSEWCAVLRNLDTDELCVRVVSFQDLIALPENPTIVAVDVPIGLLDVTFKGGRTCERLARPIVGSPLSRTVLSTVGRVALAAVTRFEASQLSRAAGGIGISAHAWGFKVKLLEVDDAMTPTRQQVIHEVHPELSFREMAGRPLQFSKKTAEGEKERVAALIAGGFPEPRATRASQGLRVPRDDFLDACAALWTAERIQKGAAKRVPAIVEKPDARGLDMAMWF